MQTTRVKKLFKQLKKKRQSIVLFVLFVGLLLTVPSPNHYFDAIVPGTGFILKKESVLAKEPLLPVKRNSEQPDITAVGMYAVDLGSGVSLISRNENLRLRPASTTKLLTALVAFDHFKLDDVIEVKLVTQEGRIMNLIPGERMTFRNLLYGALVHSANDAADAIAKGYPGGIKEFVSRMNIKATSLGMSDSHFTNPMGFDDPQHYTTAKDLSKLAQAALNNPEISVISSTRSISISDVTYRYFHDLKNVNELLGKLPGLAGLKTGYTQEGGEILISRYRPDESKDILLVLMRSEDRFGETQTVLKWIVDTYKWVDIHSIIPAN